MSFKTPDMNWSNGESPTADSYEYANGKIEDSPSIDGGVSTGDCVKQNTSSGTWETSQEGYAIYDGTDVVVSGRIATLSGLTARYNYYVQADGSISTTGTNYKAGVALDTTHLLVDISGVYGTDEAYTGQMQGLISMPSVSGYVRIKIQLPVDADGALVRCKATAWGSGDDETDGFAIADITSDTNLYGDNLWYEADIDTASSSAIPDGDTVYIKCFPYKGTIYNDTFGDNITSCTMGTLLYEYIGDNMSGATITDSAGSNNATATSLTTGTGKVGASFVGSGSGYFTLGSSFDITGKAVSIGLKCASTLSGIYGNSGSARAPFSTVEADNDIIFGHDTYYTTYTNSSTDWLLLDVEYDTSYINVWVDNSQQVTDYAWNHNQTINIDLFGKSGDFIGSTVHVYSLTGELAQIRVFSQALTNTDRSNLYNSGDWV